MISTDILQVNSLPIDQQVQLPPKSSFIVRIKGFQRIIEAVIELEDGITAIVGDSNNGKSAILRAIKAAVFNWLGNDFINYDCKTCEVEIDNAGKTLLWKKFKSGESTQYILNGEPYTKVGRNQFPKVLEIVNFKEIKILNQDVKLNFSDQLSYPFLMDKTPSQLFSFFAVSSDNEKIDKALKKMKEDLGEYKNKIVIAHSKVDILSNEIKRLEDLNSFFESHSPTFSAILGMDADMDFVNMEIVYNNASYQIKEIEVYKNIIDKIDLSLYFQLTPEINVLNQFQKDISYYNEMESIINIARESEKGRDIIKTVTDTYQPIDLSDLSIQVGTYNEIEKVVQQSTGINNCARYLTQGLNKIDKENIDLTSLMNLLNEYHGILNIVKMIGYVQDNMSTISNSLSQFESIDFQDIVNQITEVNEIVKLIDTIKSLQYSINMVKQEMETTSQNIEEVKKELRNFKQCPLCGEPLKIQDGQLSIC